MSLPSGYTRLEYIQSTGTQYIDTGFKPNQNTRLICKAKAPTTSGSNFLFGGRTSISANKFSFGSSGDKYYIGYGNGTNVTASKITNYSGVLFIDANKQNWTLTTESISETIVGGTYSSFTSPVNLVLFACNTNGTLAYGKDTLYSCQIYDNGTLIRDFVPCKNASNAIGLYDNVNKVFYINKGTGTFTAGPQMTGASMIINATAFDNALTATADAIREKAEHSQKIVWNSNSGFADAIAMIETGGKIATGTFTCNYNQNLYTTPIKISGLKFAPKEVIFYLDPLPGDSTSSNAQINDYYSNYHDHVIYGKITTTWGRAWEFWGNYSTEEYEDDEGNTVVDYYDNLAITADNDRHKCSLTSDGFSITSSSSRSSNMAGATYYWIAMG